MSYSENDSHLKQNINQQQKNQMIKQSVTQMMRLSMQNIYRVCSKSCIQDYEKSDLSDREKICISRCFDKKNETMNLTMEQFGKMTSKGEGDE